MELRIRDFAEGDRDCIIGLWERCALTRPWNDPSSDIDLAVREANATILVGVLEGVIVASLMVGYDGHRGWVYYLAIDPAQQGKGLGRRMMQEAENWLKARNAPKIQLMVRSENKAAVGFYAALGYAVQDTVVIGRRLDGKVQPVTRDGS